MASNSKSVAPTSSKSLSQSVTSKRKVSGPSHSTAPTPSPTPITSSVTPQGSNSIPVDDSTSPDVKKIKCEGKTRSGVWNHFEKVTGVDGEEKAQCIWCAKLYQCKSEGGTSGLWGHLKKICKKIPYEIKKELVKLDKSNNITQKILSFQKESGSGSGKLGIWQFDQVRVREALVRMIIKAELPFSIFSTFSTGGRTLDRFRSSLTPTTAEVLICVQDWLRASPKPVEVEELIADLSKLEIDVKNDPEIEGAVFSRSSLDC